MEVLWLWAQCITRRYAAVTPTRCSVLWQPHLLEFANNCPLHLPYGCIIALGRLTNIGVTVSCIRMHRFLQLRLESHNLPISAGHPTRRQDVARLD